MTSSGNVSGAPTEHRATIGDLEVRYLEWVSSGDPAATPVLALHGLASSANWYERLAARLSREFRVWAPDQRGHGQTTQAPTGYDWQTLAADAIRFLDHIGVERAAVLGHSWGGNVAINVAARFPERVSRLVMIDGGFLDGHLLPDASWELFRNRFAPRNVSGTRQDFLDRISEQLGDCWADDLERIVQTMVYEDESGHIQDILRPSNHAQVLESMWGDPPSVTLPNIQCPTLIVPAGPRPDRAGGEFSRTKTIMVEAAARAVPNNRVHWIPETIHDIGYHKPDELASVIMEFLAEA
ncbi:MAG: alpha/beta hydrolase [Chloroflexota bacterium]|nr:alpha/beta hydrolase [Chloroflexota bacterium]